MEWGAQMGLPGCLQPHPNLNRLYSVGEGDDLFILSGKKARAPCHGQLEQDVHQYSVKADINPLSVWNTFAALSSIKTRSGLGRNHSKTEHPLQTEKHNSRHGH